MGKKVDAASRFLLDNIGRPNYAALEAMVEALPENAEKEKWILGDAIGSEKYWDKLAITSRRRDWIFNLLTIVIAASISVVAILSTTYKTYADQWAILIGILGGVVAVLRGLDAKYPARETWLRARATQQMLVSERLEYMSGTGVYNGVTNALQLYEQRTKAIRTGEMQQWLASAKPEGSKAPQLPQGANPAGQAGSGTTPPDGAPATT